MKATGIWTSGVVAATVALAALAPQAYAQGNPLNAIQAQVQAVQQSLDEVEQKVDGVHQKLDVQAAANGTRHQALLQALADLSLKIDALAAPAGMVPFTAQAPGGLCDSGPSPSSNPQIIIEGTGSHLFVVNSILVKSAPQPSGLEGYTYFTVNNVHIDGTTFATMTGNLMATTSGWGIEESADLMGTPVRIDTPTSLLAAPRTESPSGGRFPHQIVADAAGSNDIRIQLFCRSDAFPFSVETVRVSGWRWSTDSVSVMYVPGN